MTPVTTEKVLLIGGTGFIGSHIIDACLASGLAVRVVDRSGQDKRLHASVEYMRGDYRDPEFVSRTLMGVDYVVHLAHDSLTASRDCDMRADYEKNIKPAIQLMEICCLHGIQKFVFVSSGGAVYGDMPSESEILESSDKSPISVYGTSKLIVEKIGFLYAMQKKLPFVVARPSNAYGPGQRPFRGQGFVATTMASAIARKKLQIFGDGSSVRDYIHASDIADAIVLLLNQGRVGQAYNIGSSRGISLRQLLDENLAPIFREAGLSLEVEYLPSRSVDVQYNVLSTQKIRQELGFDIKKSLNTGLRETLAWLKNEVVNQADRT